MATVEQLTEMASDGLDSTATYHDPYFYVWVGNNAGKTAEVLQYDPRDESSSVIYTTDFDPTGMKLMKPDLASDAVYTTPVQDNNHDTSVYDTGDILKLDPTTQSAEVIDNTGQDAKNPLAVVLDGKMYYWGGGGQDGATYEIDPDGDSVTHIGDMPENFREGAAGVLSDGTVYNFGGGANELDSPFSDEVWEVDPTQATGSKVAEMTYDDGTEEQSFRFNRGFGGAVQDAMYIFGGNTSVQPGEYSDSVWRIDPLGGQVTVEATIPTDIRNTMVGFSTEDVLYSFGGHTPDGDSDLVFRVVGLANTVLMFQGNLGIRGASPTTGSQVVLHDEGLGRSAKVDQQGDPVLLFDEDLSQS